MTMHRFLFLLTSFCVFFGCSEVPMPEQPMRPVTKTFKVSPPKEAGLNFVIQRALDQGMPVTVNIREKNNPREYVVTGPHPVVQKLERLASGEWLHARFFPVTMQAADVRLHIHKMIASGSLAEEDVQRIMTNAEGHDTGYGGWVVVGPKEIVERLEKISSPN